MSLAIARLDAARRTVDARLSAERHPDGYWVGELASSSLATATAIVALHLADAVEYRSLVEGGLRSLCRYQNVDGGFGDTDRSLSNISTTMLGRAALTICDPDGRYASELKRCEEWLFTRYGRTRDELTRAVRARYGKDNTFAVPILMTGALAGLVDWSAIPFLPFPMAVFPQSMYRMLRLSVVSYALPALIAIGQVIHARKRSWNPLTTAIRSMSIRPTLRVLSRIQPTSGGYLEATPLTSFVVMSLVSSGSGDSAVVKNGVRFLVESVRADGSWPIDTNLSTWVTTLAVNGMCAGNDPAPIPQRDELAAWLLGQQMKAVHPYTGAAPGGWGWTPLSGSVPDADDTPGAILALIHLARMGATIPPEAIRNGMVWLLGLANGDGGMPTFCRGWGQLPFDRSGSDLTAHAIRAIHAGRRFLADDDPRWDGLIRRGFGYLAKQQRADGSWLPLWFGNQDAPDDDNPVYGTSRVLMAYCDTDRTDDGACRRGIAWLMSVRNADGGWGGAAGCASSVEETSVALDALCGLLPLAELESSANWLLTRIESGDWTQPTPIGFYFAKLWYYERLYPATFASGALHRLRAAHGG